MCTGGTCDDIDIPKDWYFFNSSMRASWKYTTMKDVTQC